MADGGGGPPRLKFLLLGIPRFKGIRSSKRILKVRERMDSKV